MGFECGPDAGSLAESQIIRDILISVGVPDMRDQAHRLAGHLLPYVHVTSADFVRARVAARSEGHAEAANLDQPRSQVEDFHFLPMIFPELKTLEKGGVIRARIVPAEDRTMVGRHQADVSGVAAH